MIVASSAPTERSQAYAWNDLPHLAARTLWSLRKPTPDPDGEAWLLSLLSPAETLLYRSMNATDRSHAVHCAQAVERLGTDVVVASAMHDIGKVQAGLGVPGRVAASVCGLLIEDQARRWRDRGGVRGQIGRYLNHPDAGAAMLKAAGSSQLAVDWARDHHRGLEEQSIDPDVAIALLQADG